MFRFVTLFAILAMATPNVGIVADGEPYEADPDTVMRLIRNDKLDLVLPDAMRRNEIDMWIHYCAFCYPRVSGSKYFLNPSEQEDCILIGRMKDRNWSYPKTA